MFVSVGGRWLASSLWWARNGTAFRSQLCERYDIRSVTPVRRTDWHRGAKYFRAISGKHCPIFIKIDGDNRTLTNETLAWQALKKSAMTLGRFARVRFFDTSGAYRIAGFDWVTGMSLDRSAKRCVSLTPRFLISELQGIISDLKRADIIHRDITPSNLLLVTDPTGSHRKIVLVDFAFAVISGVALTDDLLPLSDLADLCSGFKPGISKWDDAFSCKRVVEVVCGAGEWSLGPGGFAVEPRAYSIDWDVELNKRRARFD